MDSSWWNLQIITDFALFPLLYLPFLRFRLRDNYPTSIEYVHNLKAIKNQDWKQNQAMQCKHTQMIYSVDGSSSIMKVIGDGHMKGKVVVIFNKIFKFSIINWTAILVDGLIEPAPNSNKMDDLSTEVRR